MKAIYVILSLSFLFLISSCQSEDSIVQDGSGYLRLEIGAVSGTNTKSSVPENYDPKQLKVEIKNASGDVVKSTDDAEDWEGTKIKLNAGTYTISASSNGWDGNTSGRDIPYYAGSTQVTVEQGKEVTATVTCTLANVKVTVKFDDSVWQKLRNAVVEVVPEDDEIKEQYFLENGTAYFPVGKLTVRTTVTNKAGKSNTLSTPLDNVKARDHYILNVKVEDSGSGNITVEADDTEKEYKYTFTVPVVAQNSLSVKVANAWSNFAYVEGSATFKDEASIDKSKIYFEYKEKEATDWITVQATQEDDCYEGTLTSLKPKTSYSYKLTYKNDGEEYASDEQTFTTEEQVVIPNLNFDSWVKDGKHWYANASMDSKFWDSGNKGANSLNEVNPTRPEESDVKNGKAARLGSTTAAGQFAAGSLFSGSFGSASVIPLGAKLDFGQPFTGRPAQLKGWFKYNPGTITHTKVDGVNKGDRDKCSIYIALADWSAPFAVSTGENKFVDLNASDIIAYGELSEDKISPEGGMASYEEFTIDIKYRDLKRKPTYVLVVCSSSKYGDYFTGSTSSVLLLDEFELIYGEPVIDTNYIK